MNIKKLMHKNIHMVQRTQKTGHVHDTCLNKKYCKDVDQPEKNSFENLKQIVMFVNFCALAETNPKKS